MPAQLGERQPPKGEHPTPRGARWGSTTGATGVRFRVDQLDKQAGDIRTLVVRNESSCEPAPNGHPVRHPQPSRTGSLVGSNRAR
jgi:hypothetical protein